MLSAQIPERSLIGRVVREVFRRERIPTRVRWWFAAEGMGDWYSLLREELAPHLGGLDRSTRLLADVAAPMLERRYDVLRGSFPTLPDRRLDARAVGLAMGGLYRIASYPKIRWLFEPVGGAPATLAVHARVEAWLAPIPIESRWVELTHHLGELLVSMTERLPKHLPRVRPIVGDICFAAGARVAKRMRQAVGMDDHPRNALELLRMSEYVFRVNPDHWGEADAKTGWLEGTACPWYDAPGWNGAHCGIFGQFQSGIASAFGLRYHLTSTIPKQGGHVCRIDVKPIPLRRAKDDVPAGAPAGVATGEVTS